jgi:hypothetical protein
MEEDVLSIDIDHEDARDEDAIYEDASTLDTPNLDGFTDIVDANEERFVGDSEGRDRLRCTLRGRWSFCGNQDECFSSFYDHHWECVLQDEIFSEYDQECDLQPEFTLCYPF